SLSTIWVSPDHQYWNPPEPSTRNASKVSTLPSTSIGQKLWVKLQIGQVGSKAARRSPSNRTVVVGAKMSASEICAPAMFRTPVTGSKVRLPNDESKPVKSRYAPPADSTSAT